MAVHRKSHPQAPMYGPGGGAGSVSFQDVAQFQGALSIGWSQLTSVPTTVSGYGITDAYTKTETDTLLAAKADVGDSYTKSEDDALLLTKADAATTLAGYGITDAYTETEVDALFAALTAADIGAGSFPSGNYTFPASLVVNGLVAIQGATFPGVAFIIGNAANYTTTGTTQYGMAVNGRFGSGASVAVRAIEFQANFASEGSSYTCPEAVHLSIVDTSLGTNAHVTTQYGIRVNALVNATNNYAIKTNAGLVDLGDQLLLKAGTTSRSTLRIPHGAAPTSPVNGDMWTTTAGLFVRINGATIGPLS